MKLRPDVVRAAAFELLAALVGGRDRARRSARRSRSPTPTRRCASWPTAARPARSCSCRELRAGARDRQRLRDRGRARRAAGGRGVRGRVARSRDRLRRGGTGALGGGGAGRRRVPERRRARRPRRPRRDRAGGLSSRVPRSTSTVSSSASGVSRRSCRPGGRIVCTASLAGLMEIPDDPVYGATKHAVVGFVRSVAPALEARGHLDQRRLPRNRRHADALRRHPGTVP